MKILNKKEIEKLEAKIDRAYGKKAGLKGLMVLERWDTYWVSSRLMAEMDIDKLGVKWIGMLLGKVVSGKFKASKEAEELFSLQSY